MKTLKAVFENVFGVIIGLFILYLFAARALRPVYLILKHMN